MRQRIPSFDEFQLNEEKEIDKMKFIKDTWNECIKKAKPIHYRDSWCSYW